MIVSAAKAKFYYLINLSLIDLFISIRFYSELAVVFPILK